MIKAIIIDLDDTLCMTEFVSFEMENETLQLLGMQPMLRDIHQATWGKPLFVIIPTRAPGVDTTAFRQQFPAVLDRYVAAGKLDAIAPENFAALDTLLDIGKQLFIVTSRTHDELKHLLEPDHGLAKRMTAFYYRDNMQYHKPDPRAFDLLLHEHSLTPDECAYIGDSVSDAEASKQAGLHFIASLESGLRSREDFQDHDVDVFIAKFNDCVLAVQQLDQRTVTIG